MKTKEERNVLKEEVETLNKNRTEITEDELMQVAGGSDNRPSIELSFELPSKYKPAPGPLVAKFPPEK